MVPCAIAAVDELEAILRRVAQAQVLVFQVQVAGARPVLRGVGVVWVDGEAELGAGGHSVDHGVVRAVVPALDIDLEVGDAGQVGLEQVTVAGDFGEVDTQTQFQSLSLVDDLHVRCGEGHAEQQARVARVFRSQERNSLRGMRGGQNGETSGRIPDGEEGD